MIKEFIKLFTEFFKFLGGRKQEVATAPDPEKVLLRARIRLSKRNKELLKYIEDSGLLEYHLIKEKFPWVDIRMRLEVLKAKGFITDMANNRWKISDNYLPFVQISNDDTTMSTE